MTFSYIDVDLLLIDVNKMYLSVYTTMAVDILFFFIYIHALKIAIEEE